jgi:hypothetical protein
MAVGMVSQTAAAVAVDEGCKFLLVHVRLLLLPATAAVAAVEAAAAAGRKQQGMAQHHACLVHCSRPQEEFLPWPCQFAEQQQHRQLVAP